MIVVAVLGRLKLTTGMTPFSRFGRVILNIVWSFRFCSLHSFPLRVKILLMPVFGLSEFRCFDYLSFVFAVLLFLSQSVLLERKASLNDWLLFRFLLKITFLDYQWLPHSFPGWNLRKSFWAVFFVQLGTFLSNIRICWRFYPSCLVWHVRRIERCLHSGSLDLLILFFGHSCKRVIDLLTTNWHSRTECDLSDFTFLLPLNNQRSPSVDFANCLSIKIYWLISTQNFAGY